MTTVTTTPTDVTFESSPVRRLRAVMHANAFTSFAGGLVGLAGAPWISDELGFDQVALTRMVGIGLMLFAIGVEIIARSRTDHAVTWSALVSVADFTWVAATIAVIATGALTTAGVMVAAAVGLVVLDYGVVQLWLRNEART